MKSIKVVILAITILACSCASRRITQQQAIQIAEQYVQEHGYTTVKVNLDSVKTSYDISELLGMSKEQIAEMRYNTFLPTAYKASKHWGRWHVIFISNIATKYGITGRDYDNSRIVSMNRKGQRIYVMHQEVVIPKSKEKDK